MKKEDIAARLTAAGITFPASANKAALEQLAVANGISLDEPEGENPEEPEPSAEAEPLPLAQVDVAAAAEIAAQTAKPETPEGVTEAAILEKTAVGMTREQAIEVLQAQARHDAGLATSEGKA